MTKVKGLIAAGLLLHAAHATAQDDALDVGQGEVIVTAMRREADDYSASIPAVGLVRRADFAVVQVSITGDTRDKVQRETEIYAMIRNAIVQAGSNGVQLAYGERTLQPLTQANYRSLTLRNDNRPDSQRTGFLVKVALAEGVDAKAAQDRITAFVKAVKPVGRALMNETGDLQLSIVAPDQYRLAVAEAILADAKALAAKAGDRYGVEVEGLNRPVEWARRGLSDVLIYIPYRLLITPVR